MNPNRREWITAAGIAGATALSATHANTASAAPAKDRPFGFSFNTSTIRGQGLSIDKEVELIGKAGWDAVEPWIRELQDFVKKGGNLKDLGKKISDAGMKVESSIGFARWIVSDDMERQKGLDEAKRDMEMVLTIGGKRLAAPPIGAHDAKSDKLPLQQIADRYRKLAELGQQVGVIPEVELWGFSKNLSRLAEVVFVAVESGHSQACILPDIYHLYKGGSSFDAVKLLAGKSIGIFHMNDYPKDKDSKSIGDADRVYPGDGVAPLTETLRTLRDIGYQGMLSLELFNPEYYKRPAEEVVTTGLAKLKAVVEKAMAKA